MSDQHEALAFEVFNIIAEHEDNTLGGQKRACRAVATFILNEHARLKALVDEYKPHVAQLDTIIKEKVVTIDGLEQQIERLRKAVEIGAVASAEIKLKAGYIKSLETRNKHLAELAKYADHTYHCSGWAGGDCDCGFDALLAKDGE